LIAAVATFVRSSAEMSVPANEWMPLLTAANPTGGVLSPKVMVAVKSPSGAPGLGTVKVVTVAPSMLGFSIKVVTCGIGSFAARSACRWVLVSEVLLPETFGAATFPEDGGAGV
jgi:hypothetical protein